MLPAAAVMANMLPECLCCTALLLLLLGRWLAAAAAGRAAAAGATQQTGPALPGALAAGPCPASDDKMLMTSS